MPMEIPDKGTADEDASLDEDSFTIDVESSVHPSRPAIYASMILTGLEVSPLSRVKTRCPISKLEARDDCHLVLTTHHVTTLKWT